MESPGFEPADVAGVRVRSGDNRREVKLKIAKLAETVQVGRDPRERASDPRGNAFATVLDQAQIDELPDDPDEMEQMLRDMAGPGSVLRVNGFRGGRLPPKGQIQQIRFRRNMFAADTHEPGFVSIDITTKPGIDNWRGSTGLGFRSDALSARNAFAPVKGDEQYERYSFSVSGPLWKQHTSLSLSADGTDAFDSKTIVAALPSGYFSDSVRKPNDSINFTARLEHMLTKSQMFRAEFQRSHSKAENLGVGDYDLVDRGYRQTRTENVLRASNAGAIGKTMYNELRVQWLNEGSTFTPTSVAPAVLVLNAFNAGGAQLVGSSGSDVASITDDLDIATGRHAIRAGVQLDAGRYRTERTAKLRRHVHVRQPRRLRRRHADHVLAKCRRSTRGDFTGAAGSLRAGRHPRAEGFDRQRRPAAGVSVARRRLQPRAARRHHLVAVQERQDDDSHGRRRVLRLVRRADVRTSGSARRHASADRNGHAAWLSQRAVR